MTTMDNDTKPIPIDLCLRATPRSLASMLATLNCGDSVVHDMKAPNAMATSRSCSTGAAPELAAAFERNAGVREHRWRRMLRWDSNDGSH